VSAQYSHGITPNGPSHALKPSYSKSSGDTLYYISYSPNPFDPNANLYDGSPRITGYTVIKRSKDGLTDTLFINSGLARIDIRHYNEKQQLVYSVFEYPPCKIGGDNCVGPEYLYEKTEHEYDSENRVSKVTVKQVGSISGVESIFSINTYDYAALEMTEKGYIYNGYEYELDQLNRVTYLKTLDSPDEYKELDGKEYCIADSYFTYFEGGLSVIRNERTSVMILGWPDRWVKVDYFFNEDSRLKNTYISLDGKEWTVWEKSETRYVYATNSGEFPNSNESIASSGTNVYGTSGAIVVSTENNAQASIYSTTGQVVKKQAVNAGTTQITVRSGFYFVTVDNKTYKVIVR
jgi:hypothetical protein